LKYSGGLPMVRFNNYEEFNDVQLQNRQIRKSLWQSAVKKSLLKKKPPEG